MNKHDCFAVALWALLLSVVSFSCKPPSEPETTPPMPQFVPTSLPPDPNDRGIFADFGAGTAIVVQWEPDSTASTTGYLLYRSAGDSSVGSDGLLLNRTTVADLESNNFPLTTPQTYFEDNTNITPGARYYYQLQGMYRASNNTVTYGPPTHPGLATSFHFVPRVVLEAPLGTDSLHGSPLQLRWEDPNSGGTYQIIVQRLDDQEFVCSHVYADDANPVATTYPDNATPLEANVPYQWRVKWIEPNGGSSSVWTGFTIVP